MKKFPRIFSAVLALCLAAAVCLPVRAAGAQDCGAKLRIGAATDEDLDRLCCRMTLQIPGKKG